MRGSLLVRVPLSRLSQTTLGSHAIVPSELAPFLRKPLDTSTSARLVGGLFELDGKSVLVASAYLPTGLDYKPASSDEASEAQSIYTCIKRWSNSADLALVLGDLNETVADRDRSENLPGVHHCRFISSPSTPTSLTACSLIEKGALPAKRPFLVVLRCLGSTISWPKAEPFASTSLLC